jgi:thioesterase domain-containing protein
MKSSATNISASLVPIRSSGSQSPFFCIHSLDPCLLFYQPLAQHLEADRPFYGIQPYDDLNQLIAFPTIEEMATYYLREIRSIQPHGPYYLGGFSFGGYVAFEIARQLNNQGERVALLAIFDTAAPGVEQRLSVLAQSVKFWQLSLKYGRRFIYSKLINRLKIYRQFIKDTWQKKSSLLPKLTFRQQQQWSQSIEINERAFCAYDPDIYPGKVTLFTAGYSVNTVDLQLGWQRLAGSGLETIEVPGDHSAIFDRVHAIVLARELNKCIHRA